MKISISKAGDRIVQENKIENKDRKPAEDAIVDSVDTFSGHLEALRAVLIKSAITIAVVFIIIFMTVSWWFGFIGKGADIVVMGPFEVIRFYFRTSGAISIGLSIPFMLYYLWQFVQPRLIPKDARIMHTMLPLMIVLFLVGLLFGYFVVHPISYFALINMGEQNFDVLITADEYMSFLLVTTIPLGLVFQLPLVVLFLNYLELLDSELMRSIRKFAYFGLLVITALIAPPDIFSHLLTLTPMILLYEFSILLVKRKEKRDRLKEEV
ncbi:twin-arginine translocase subunit TatC [Salinicoccus halitifaciens]|uniref:Sec-independent protein translocase protein TatC n=1 Tax=Salinicoccus halitifaciens TaxID=1073415 RepID=A0ABV2ECF7_9STAP|nr:twin-arginine translocase subunit TatC [Salinicoccus halitifaciens]MCD2138717.1 twin-arginine translocase subunit TatC [Salinicoccus halitifaciens]